MTVENYAPRTIRKSKLRGVLGAIRRAIAGLGVDVFPYGIMLNRSKVVSGMRYAAVRPIATLSPWRTDEEFLRLREAIRQNTMVDELRCFELWELAAQVLKLPGSFLEVGVWRGGSGALLAHRAKRASPAKTIYLCDTFRGVPKVSDKDSLYRGGEHSDTTEEIVVSLLDQLGLDNAIIKRGLFPEDFADEMRNETFCFVHIDVDVYQSAKDVFDFCWPRMPVGGVVVFDDYGFVWCDGIPKLIAEYRGQSDKLIIHNLNGHAIVVKIG